jgi:hypothetical protein
VRGRWRERGGDGINRGNLRGPCLEDGAGLMKVSQMGGGEWTERKSWEEREMG